MIGDTNLFVGLMRGDPQAVAFLADEPELVMPFVVAAELLIGAHLSAHPERESRHVARLHRVYPILWPDMVDVIEFSNVSVQVRRAGTPLGINDLWIAALSRRRQIPVVSEDKDLTRVPGLSVVGWR